MRRLGWNTNGFISPLSGLGEIVNGISSLTQQETLEDADVSALLTRLTQFFAALRGLRSASGLPSSIDANAFRSEFPGQLRDYLFVEYLLGQQPRLGRALQLGGVIRIREIPA